MNLTQAEPSADGNNDLFAQSPVNDDISFTQGAPERTIEVVMEDFEKDPDSASDVGIIAIETKDDGTVEHKPVHFFLKDREVVSFGAGHNPNPPLPDISFEGKGSIGMSNIAASLLYNSKPETLTLESRNRLGTTVTRKQDNSSETLELGQKTQLFEGDQFSCTHTGSNGEKLCFLLHNGPVKEQSTSTTEAVSAEVLTTMTTTTTDPISVMKRRHDLEIGQCIQRLQLLQSEVNSSTSDVEMEQYFESHLPVVANTLSNIYPDLLPNAIESKSSQTQPKRKRSHNQEMRRAASESKKARKAQEQLSRVPLRPHNTGRISKNDRKAAQTVSKTKKTVCRFWKNGFCRDGDDCLFLHPDSDPPGQTEAKTGVCGKITDWKTRSSHEFGFVEALNTTFYCDGREIPADMNPAKEQLPIDVTFDVKPTQKPGKRAEAVNVKWV